MQLFQVTSNFFLLKKKFKNLTKIKYNKGNPLLLDFFLDEEESAGTVDLMGKSSKPAPSAPAPSPSAQDVTASMNSLKSLITPELVKSKSLRKKKF